MRQVPRLYQAAAAAETSPARTLSPVSRPPPSAEAWPQPARTSPFTSSRINAPAPVKVEAPRPPLPGLPPALGMDRAPAPRPPTRDHHQVADGYRDSIRPGTTQLPPQPQHQHQQQQQQQQPPPPPPPAAASAAAAAAATENSPRYAPGGYDFSYRQPNHVSATSPSHRPFERIPYSSPHYEPSYHDYARYSDLGRHMGLVSDSKQRKRRGNLPKETTDKLRAWFMAHLTHPYPTEDEKQELMRQTGLQMSEFYIPYLTYLSTYLGTPLEKGSPSLAQRKRARE